jgi:2-oxo-4-hydroxy-4-carboxy-5-ureidoimidazoline decarboxylase
MSSSDARQGQVPSSLSGKEFLDVYGGVYEHSPWVAEALLAKGLGPDDDDPGRLADRMAAIVEAASHERKIELLNLHPELVGKLGIGEELTDASKSEQASARLDHCTPDEFARFQELNTLYRARFGFPFIVAVRGLTRADILKAFETRIGNDPETEFKAALGQVHRIARLRIESIARGR